MVYITPILVYSGPAITKGFLKAMFNDPDFNYMDFKE